MKVGEAVGIQMQKWGQEPIKVTATKGSKFGSKSMRGSRCLGLQM